MTGSAATVGTVDDEVDGSRLADPYQLYQLLREQRPVARVTVPPGVRAWLVTRYRDVRAALADPRLAKDSASLIRLMRRHSEAGQGYAVAAEAFAEHMLNSDPPDHTRLRRLVGRAFTTRGIAGLRPRIEQIAAGLLDDVAARAAAGGGEVDLIDSFAFPLPITVITELLGVPPDRRDEFRRWSNTLLSSAPVAERDAAAGAMAGYLRDLVDRKRGRPGPDMLSTIVAAGEADQLSGREAVSMAFLLLVAGHETTVNLIGNGVLALLRHPDQLAALREDPSLIPAAVEEFLRYDGPVNTATFRYTTEPVEISGTTIPAEELVVLALASANRDPEQYPDADRLDIRREAGHLAFGHGIHHCLGAPLARLEGEIAFRGLLGRFPHLALARPPEQLRWRPSHLLRGLTALPVRPGG